MIHLVELITASVSQLDALPGGVERLLQVAEGQPTTPEPTCEMKTPSNCTNRHCHAKRAASVVRSSRRARVLCRVSVVCGYAGCFDAVL